MEGIIENFSSFYEVFVNDQTEAKHSLVMAAVDKLLPVYKKGYYGLDDLENLNYSEICNWLGWPDLQDGGIFEQAIEILGEDTIKLALSTDW